MRFSSNQLMRDRNMPDPNQAMSDNPYQPPSKSSNGVALLAKRSALWSYGVLNAILTGLLATPYLLLAVRAWLFPYFVGTDLDGEPVTYQYTFDIGRPSLFVLAVYFCVPNAILSHFRRKRLSA